MIASTEKMSILDLTSRTTTEHRVSFIMKIISAGFKNGFWI